MFYARRGRKTVDPEENASRKAIKTNNLYIRLNSEGLWFGTFGEAHAWPAVLVL